MEAREIEPYPPGNMERQKGVHDWLKCMMGCEIDERKEVVKLECMHFLCSDECIEKLKSGTASEVGFKCLTCSRVTQAIQFSVKVIPADIFTMKKKAADVQLICDYCIFNKTAVAYCPECPKYLCRKCKNLHPQIRTTAEHTLEDDLTHLKIQELPRVLEEESRCKIHNIPGNSFCRTCKLRICELCRPDHGEHLTVLMDTVKESLKSKIENTRTLVEHFEKATVEIEKKKKELQTSQWESTVKSIDDHFKVLHDELTKREEKMKEETRVYFTGLVGHLDKKKKSVEFTKTQNEKLVNIGEYMINDMEEIAAVKLWGEHEDFFGDLENLEARDSRFSRFFETFEKLNVEVQVNETAAADAKEFLAKVGKINLCARVDATGGDQQQVDGELRIQSDNNVIEKQQDNATSSTSCVSEKEDAENNKSNGISKPKSNMEGELVGNSIFAMEPVDENPNAEFSCGLIGNIDAGDNGKFHKVFIKPSQRKRQVAVKSTGCPQKTARSVQRLNAAKQLQMRKNRMKAVVHRPHVKSQKFQAVSNGDNRMEADPSATEIRSPEQGRGKRQRKRKEYPNFIYSFKTAKRAKERLDETTGSQITVTKKTCAAKNSHLSVIENYNLMEEDDELDLEIVQIAAAIQAAESSNSETPSEQDDDSEENPTEPVAGPSGVSVTCSRARSFTRETFEAAGVLHPKPKKSFPFPLG